MNNFEPAALLTPLPAISVAGRSDRVRAEFGPAGIDQLLVTDLSNVQYLTGFSGSAGRVLITDDFVLLVTDGRYAAQAPVEVAAAKGDVKVEIGVSMAEQNKILKAAVAPGPLGLEADSITWAEQRALADGAWGPDLVATSGVVEAPRAIKDKAEIARLARACAIADAALNTVKARLIEGLTESDFGQELDQTMRRFGAAAVSFETIVASGPNGAKPHHRPGDRLISEGDLVVVDFGALVDGYHSDMTRTFMVGEVSDTQRRMFDVVVESQAAGVAAVAAGVACADVDEACRRVIAGFGWADAFSHSTGHGIGLLIHEAPSVAKTSKVRLQPGHVITVEPGVYLAGHGGVRIEDSLVVTETGAVPITLATKDPNPLSSAA